MIDKKYIVDDINDFLKSNSYQVYFDKSECKTILDAIQKAYKYENLGEHDKEIREDERQKCQAEIDELRKCIVFWQYYQSENNKTREDYEKEIREDERRKFAEWLTMNDYLKFSMSDCACCRYKDSDCNGNCYDGLLERYENE